MQCAPREAQTACWSTRQARNGSAVMVAPMGPEVQGGKPTVWTGNKATLRETSCLGNKALAHENFMPLDIVPEKGV